MSGKCKTCNPGYHHGPKQACELRWCPGSGAQLKIMDDKCSGHGKCSHLTGTCKCQFDYSGESCYNLKCKSSNSVLYSYDNPSACDGHGACSVDTGECQCEHPYHGDTCEKKVCKADCMGRGECNEALGKCFCEDPFWGPQCEFRNCPNDCGEGGWCDNLTGKCLCKYGYGGKACKKVLYCPAASIEGDSSEPSHEVNWYQLWDKPGWALCPTGQSIYALYRSDCEALSCLDSAKCAGLCEESIAEETSGMEVRHCYHSQKWYDSFDEEGWSVCEPNYFVSGLYRSCESLYCLQMAKCCSYKGTRWAQCEEVNWGASFNRAGWSEVPGAKWIVGFWRSKGHQLQNIDKVKACTYSRGF